MKKLLVVAFFLMSCAKTSTYQENTKTLYEEYKSAFKYYTEAEDDYIVLLSNLERYPKDQYLLIRKQLMRKDIEQNRMLMIQARTEFEKALREWDMEVLKMETAPPNDSIDIRQIFGIKPPPESLSPVRDEK